MHNPVFPAFGPLSGAAKTPLGRHHVNVIIIIPYFFKGRSRCIRRLSWGTAFPARRGRFAGFIAAGLRCRHIGAGSKPVFKVVSLIRACTSISLGWASLVPFGVNTGYQGTWISPLWHDFPTPDDKSLCDQKNQGFLVAQFRLESQPA
jgi:hypothetical protein